MRKLGVFIFGALLVLSTFNFADKTIDCKAASQEKIVYVGGMAAGFTLKAGGAQIIGLNEVAGEEKSGSPALECGLRVGDIITKIGGIKIDSIVELNEIINKNGDKEIEIEALRGTDLLQLCIQPIKEKNSQKYKIGVLVRDNLSGIGTITYIDGKNGRFGSLGHSVTAENKHKMDLSEGMVYECSIVGINKGARGRAGELKGMFLNDKTFGTAEKMCECGIFGCISKSFDYENLVEMKADSLDAIPGNAYIYSTVTGEIPQKYEIEIVKVDKNNQNNKNYVVKITDETLLSETGGIVQGMSGSPIIQNNKLIGAITHVFLNDPTRGYGIDIMTMLNE